MIRVLLCVYGPCCLN